MNANQTAQDKNGYELREICGIKVLVFFQNSSEHLHLSIVFNNNNTVLETRCLIAHGMLPNYSYNQAVPENRKTICLQTVESFVKSADKSIYEDYEEDNDVINVHFKSKRGFIHIVKTNLHITDLNLFDDYLKNCNFYRILEKTTPAYFTESEKQRFIEIATKFLAQNEIVSYLEAKAKSLGEFWSNKLNTTGNSGHPMINALMAISKSDRQLATKDDRKLLFDAVYNRTKEYFAQGEVLFISTDYGPDYELRQILQENNLGYLIPYLPCKTWMHLDFSDAPSLFDFYQNHK